MPPMERPLRLSRDSLGEVARREAQEAERKALMEMLERVQWNALRTAGKPLYKTLRNKIEECGLRPLPRHFSRGTGVPT